MALAHLGEPLGVEVADRDHLAAGAPRSRRCAARRRRGRSAARSGSSDGSARARRARPAVGPVRALEPRRAAPRAARRRPRSSSVEAHVPLRWFAGEVADPQLARRGGRGAASRARARRLVDLGAGALDASAPTRPRPTGRSGRCARRDVRDEVGVALARSSSTPWSTSAGSSSGLSPLTRTNASSPSARRLAEALRRRPRAARGGRDPAPAAERGDRIVGGLVGGGDDDAVEPARVREALEQPGERGLARRARAAPCPAAARPHPRLDDSADHHSPAELAHGLSDGLVAVEPGDDAHAPASSR